MHGVLPWQDNWPVGWFLGICLVYVFLSEFFHFVVFSFVAPYLLGRPHVFPGADEPAVDGTTDMTLQLDPPKPPITIGNAKIPADKLIMLEAQDNYLCVLTSETESLERFKISAAVSLLDEESGLMIHRSRWVAYSWVERLEYANSQYSLKLKTGETVAVASTRTQQVVEEMERMGFLPVLASRRHQGAS